MAATRVRVSFEYRNGDGNFLSTHVGEFVAIKHEEDLEALDAAYLVALHRKGIRQKRIREALAARKANHD